MDQGRQLLIKVGSAAAAEAAAVQQGSKDQRPSGGDIRLNEWQQHYQQQQLQVEGL